MQKSFVQDMRSIKVDDQERKGLFKPKLYFVPVKWSIDLHEVWLKTKILNKAAACRHSLDKQRENGVQRVATNKATPRDDEIHVTDRANFSEQTGNVILIHDTQRKLKEENTEHISDSFILSSSNNSLIDLPYASEVKQISTLTVNDSSINMTNNDENERDGLLPSLPGFREKVTSNINICDFTFNR